MFRQFIRDYLRFGKRDRIGLLTLGFLIVLVYFLPVLFARKSSSFRIENDGVLAKAIDSLESNSGKENRSPKQATSFDYDRAGKTSRAFTGVLFQFDPNTLSADGWLHLGLREKTIKTILNYRSKGGKFRKPEDLAKIWGLPPGFYERVKTFILIASSPVPESFKPESSFKKEFPTIHLVNINEADTSTLIALPGIGSKLALRIINFRDKLGGFYSIDQVAETYGLQDSVFQKIKKFLQPGDGIVKKININLATKDELKSHPYFKWNIANAIVEYRNQHGNFKTADELRKINAIDEMVFKKILPYIKTE